MANIQSLGGALKRPAAPTAADAAPPAPSGSVDDAARKVIQGAYGVGQDRFERLRKEGYDPEAVQKRVNELLSSKAPALSIEEIARKVIQGAYGVGQDRFERLRKEGYDPEAVQKKVNELLRG